MYVVNKKDQHSLDTLHYPHMSPRQSSYVNESSDCANLEHRDRFTFRQGDTRLAKFPTTHEECP